MKLFSDEELEELKRFDTLIDENFKITRLEIKQADDFDRDILYLRSISNDEKKLKDYYYERTFGVKLKKKLYARKNPPKYNSEHYKRYKERMRSALSEDGVRIKNWRISNNLTIKDLSKLYGVALCTASRWESGERKAPQQLYDKVLLWEMTNQ